MTPQDWAAFTLTILSIIALITGGVKWLIQRYIKDAMETLKELKKNGGSSVKDKVDKLEIRMAEAEKVRNQMKEDHKSMKEKLDHMYDILLDYIARNAK